VVALFSRDVTTKAPALGTKAVETIVNEITSGSFDGHTFQVLSFEVTLPDVIKNEIDNQSANNQINAVYHDDVVHIIAPKKNIEVYINAQKSPCRNKGLLPTGILLIYCRFLICALILILSIG